MKPKFLIIAQLALLLSNIVMVRADPSPCPSSTKFGLENSTENLKVEVADWFQKGFLPITEQQFLDLNVTLRSAQFLCEDRVYLDPKDQNTEVSYVNIPGNATQAPLIIVGLKRLNERHNIQLKKAIDETKDAVL
ncbi:MAG: hypothetical protein EOP09_19560, partial [Proteobacteria bacterium]